MVRIRHGSLVIGLGVALALVAACKKDDKKTDNAAQKGDKGDKGDQTAEKPSGITANAASGDDLALIPRESEVVIGINVAQVQQSALWKQFVAPKLMDAAAQKKIENVKAKCGIDPVSAVRSITIGAKGVTNNKPDGVIVIHGIDKAKAMSCLDTMKGEMTADGTEITRDGDVVLIKNTKNNGQVAFTYVNDGTALAVFGDQVNAASLKAIQASDQTLKSSKPFLEMYQKINTGDSLWLLLSGKVLEKGASMGMKTSAVFGSLNVTDGLTLDLRLRFDSPDAASQFVSMGKAQAQQAAKMFDKIDITNDGPEAKISVVLSNQKLQALITQFAGLMSAFGGMGGGTGTP